MAISSNLVSQWRRPAWRRLVPGAARLPAAPALLVAFLLYGDPTAGAESAPPRPRYDLDVHLDLARHEVRVRERVAWVNVLSRPVAELIFNVHARYDVTQDQAWYQEKMLEILRLTPSEFLDYKGPAGDVRGVVLLSGEGVETRRIPIPFGFDEKLKTALRVELPEPLRPFQQIQVEIDYVLRLPQRQGKWGQWKGVTCLSDWLPVLAHVDENGWKPVPYVFWHQAVYQEAAVWSARLRLPASEKLAVAGVVREEAAENPSEREVAVLPHVARDFSLACSARFAEFRDRIGPIEVRCLAFPEHEHYARTMMRYAGQALAAFGRWIGPYPYDRFTIVEAPIGWESNEAAGLALIDERLFSMPHAAEGFAAHRTAREVAHQWFYNAVGSDGFNECWIDEGFANYLTHRFLDEVRGKNDLMLELPKGFEWLPQIRRQELRHFNLYWTLGRGEAGPLVQEIPKFEHLGNLMSMVYDRGSKVVDLIEARLGRERFDSFLHQLYERHQFGVLHVDDLQRELAEFSGESWDLFFQQWVHGAKVTDWRVEQVRVEPIKQIGAGKLGGEANRWRAVVVLQQCGGIDEPTTLRIEREGRDGYCIDVPILRANATMPPNVDGAVGPLENHRLEVHAELPSKPTQVTVDPEGVLIDQDPSNNSWRPRFRFRLTPLYTMLDETDLTNAYDRWNVIAGPWVADALASDPWFSLSTMAGFRLGLYRTQRFTGGLYTAYRSDFRDIAEGVDASWYNVPFPKMQLGLNVEKSLFVVGPGGTACNRSALFARYVFDDTDSFYQNPIHYLETFVAHENQFLPPPREVEPGAVRFRDLSNLGLHYHLNLLTPYWDPEKGLQWDAIYGCGFPVLGQPTWSQQASSQLSMIRRLPEGLGWLSETRLAGRVYGAVASPQNAQLFSLGGSELFRGFDLAQRQGNAVWVGTAEWRVPLGRDLDWSCFDSAARLHRLYLATFYDVGCAYLNGHVVGTTAHACGTGLRMDVAWFSFMERTVFRFDVAKSVRTKAPTQFWLGFEHPF